MKEKFYLERHSISVKLSTKDEDIYQFIKGFSSLQKAVDFIFAWRYTIDSQGIELDYDKTKLTTSPVSSEFKLWLKKNKNKKIIYIQDNNWLLYEYLGKIKKKTFLATFLKESIRLYLYGQKVEPASSISDSIESTLSSIESKIDFLLLQSEEEPKVTPDTSPSTESKEEKERQKNRKQAKDIFGKLSK